MLTVGTTHEPSQDVPAQIWRDAHAPPEVTAPRERLARLYDQHGARAYRYLLALLGDRGMAEDALQSAFLELSRRPEALERIESPLAYLLASARNAALRDRRRGERRRQVEQTAASMRILEARDPTPQDPAETEKLEWALRQLPLEQREVIVLKALEGLTFPEIGQALGVSPNTAASRYRYALEKLRDLLG
jgi:RNA polymerase sigma-70 factor, ECF subfamily